MDKFLALKDFKKQADILKEKLDVDKNLTEIKENEVKASDNMVTVNKLPQMQIYQISWIWLRNIYCKS